MQSPSKKYRQLRARRCPPFQTPVLSRRRLTVALKCAIICSTVQFKVHLLTAEHLMMSHGFIYDNPAIWSILDRTLLKELASPLRPGGKSTLIIQVNEVPKNSELPG